MANDKKISELELAQNLTLQDYLAIVNGGDTKKLTLQGLKTFLGEGMIHSIVQIASYQAFSQLVQNSSLVAGQLYAVPYQCVHVIPGTTVLNIDSPQYVETIETFIVQAISDSTINPHVVSLQHPTDEIIWDIQSNTAEDSTTARSGKVVYRCDIEHKLSAYFDFRATYFRRGYADTSNLPTYTQQEWTRDSIVVASSMIQRAKRTHTSEESVNPDYWQNWQRMVNASSSQWLWSDITSVAGADIPRDTNCIDTLCFINSQNIRIGKTLNNNGLNNIVFSNCNNIQIGDGSYNAHFISCNNIQVKNAVETSIFDSVNTLSAITIINSTFLRCQSLTLRNPSCDSFTDTECLVLGENSSGDNFDVCSNLSVLHGSTNNSYTYVNNTTIGNNANGNYLRAVQQCEIKNDLLHNVLHGVNNSTIGNAVSYCNFASVSGLYTQWRYVMIGDGCSAIGGENGAVVQHSTFSAGTRNVFVSSGGEISNSIFGHYCSDILVGQGAKIEDSSFGASCESIHLDLGAQIKNTIVGASLDTLTMGSSSYIKQTTIGADCQNIILQAGVRISDSHFGASCTNITFGIGSSFSYSKLEGNNDAIAFENGVDLQDAIISHNLDNKTFSNEYGGDIIGGKTIADNSETIVYGRSESAQNAKNAKDSVFVVADSNSIDFATLTTRNIKLMSSVSTSLAILRMEVNVPVLMLLHNDGSEDCIFEIGGNYGNDVKLQLSVATQTKALYEIMRVKVGDIDRIIQIRDAVIL